VGGGVQLGPLGTAATNWPIVRAPGDYDDGEIGGMISRVNRSSRRKPVPVPLCPPQTPHAGRKRTRAIALRIEALFSTEGVSHAIAQISTAATRVRAQVRSCYAYVMVIFIMIVVVTVFVVVVALFSLCVVCPLLCL
jgi:hypothetical protein